MLVLSASSRWYELAGGWGDLYPRAPVGALGSHGTPKALRGFRAG